MDYATLELRVHKKYTETGAAGFIGKKYLYFFVLGFHSIAQVIKSYDLANTKIDENGTKLTYYGLYIRKITTNQKTYCSIGFFITGLIF